MYVKKRAALQVSALMGLSPMSLSTPVEPVEPRYFPDPPLTPHPAFSTIEFENVKI